MSSVPEEELTKAIREILQNANLEALSRKMVRKKLETQFGVDMNDIKSFINDQITSIIEEQQQEESEEGSGSDDSESEEEEVEEAPKKKRSRTSKKSASSKTKAKSKSKKEGSANRSNAFQTTMAISPELSKVLGETQLPRPQIVKKLWDYIKEHNLQDPNDKRSILLDDTLRGVFNRDSFTMFSMNKYLKYHVRKIEEIEERGWDAIVRNGESSEEDEAKKLEKERKKQLAKERKLKRKKGEKVKTKRAPNPNSGLNKPLKLSDELADIVGEPELSRPQVVKQLWVYIKEHELQNPENRKEILCDDKLSNLFGEERVTMFSMNKLLARHFIKPE